MLKKLHSSIAAAEWALSIVEPLYSKHTQLTFQIHLGLSTLLTSSLLTQTTGPTTSASILWSQWFSSFMILPIKSFQILTLSFSLKNSFPSLSLMHLPPSNSLISVFNPFCSLNIPLGHFFYSVCASLAFSFLAFETASFFFFHPFIPPVILLNNIPTHRLVCIFLPWKWHLHLFIPPQWITFSCPTPLLSTHLIKCL